MKFAVCISEISFATFSANPSCRSRPTRRRCIVGCSSRIAGSSTKWSLIPTSIWLPTASVSRIVERLVPPVPEFVRPVVADPRAKRTDLFRHVSHRAVARRLGR
jgi:hypothetical protein